MLVCLNIIYHDEQMMSYQTSTIGVDCTDEFGSLDQQASDIVVKTIPEHSGIYTVQRPLQDAGRASDNRELLGHTLRRRRDIALRILLLLLWSLMHIGHLSCTSR